MKKTGFLFIQLIIIMLLSACATHHKKQSNESLNQLFKDYTEWSSNEFPSYAAYIGIPNYKNHHKIVDLSQKAIDQRYQQQKVFLKRLQNIRLHSEDDRVNARLFQFTLEGGIKSYEFNTHLMPYSAVSGHHSSFLETHKRIPLKTQFDYRQLINKIRSYPRYNDQIIENMRRGLTLGYLPPQIIFKGTSDSIKKSIIRKKKEHPLFTPFLNLPDSFPQEVQLKLQTDAWNAIQLFLNPANKKFYDFFTKEYYPKLRKRISISSLPKGLEYYNHRVRRETTTDLSFKDIHQLGLQEVARIKSEMMDIIQKVKFRGNFKQFVKMLRSDKKFYAKSEEELMQKVALTLKQMDGALPKLFSKLPRTPYGIRKVPSHMAPKQTTAYYWPPSADGSRAGFYYVNTYDLKSRPLYEVEALSYHEAVPGHHLQIALQMENQDVPMFRRSMRMTAFVEGWALYSEALGKDLGFYQDPYSDFGRLTYEMWRACRLVVDTGIHGLNWTRDQAIKFMEDHTALSKLNIRSEVDRYISWPGQALGYKMGQLKIKELRHKAEQNLGSNFDIREFHDLILEQGAIPLDLLEKRVMNYIKDKSAKLSQGA